MKSLSSIILTFALIFITVSPVSAAPLPEKSLDLNGYTIIIHTNDSHSRAINDSGQGQMGFTTVSALKKHYETMGVEVILLDAGDTFHGLPFANLVGGSNIVEIMNLAGYDAMTPGNHDFNYGTDALVKLKADMDFTLLSSNLKQKSNGKDLLEDNIIIEENGVKYGIFGLSTPETVYKTNPNNVSTVDFIDPIEAAREEVIELKADGAQVIIALSHLGIDESSEFTSKLVAEKVDGIDLIVDGHSHSVLNDGLEVNDTLIVSTGDYIKNIGIVIISPDGNMDAQLITPEDFAETDPIVDEMVASYSSKQDELLSEVIGYTTVSLDGVREHVRASETNLGNLATDAFLWKTGADVAFTNGGGIRSSIEIGDITKKDIVTVFPFGNYLVTKNITGKALLEALELGVSAYPELLGGFLQVSGITCSFDPSKPAGSRVVEAKVKGTTLDPKAMYLIATNDFMVVGGDGYTMLADFEVVNEFGSMEEILIEYLEEIGDVDIEMQDRITVYEPEELVEEDKDIGEDADAEEDEDIEVDEDAVADKDTDMDKDVDMDKDADMDEKADVYDDDEIDKDTEVAKYEQYKVKQGDYLRKIALEYFDEESKWTLIYDWNKDTITNPDLIYVGQELNIYSE
ncbi:MAG TPA: 5'-nucleotidase C-terminal domain-containing protein [Mobilitalea sp.]|nr:5'-nucleotidase C-terminal domain-containing protein [Mobilitalea sp.]